MQAGPITAKITIETGDEKVWGQIHALIQSKFESEIARGQITVHRVQAGH